MQENGKLCPWLERFTEFMTCWIFFSEDVFSLSIGYAEANIPYIQTCSFKQECAEQINVISCFADPAFISLELRVITFLWQQIFLIVSASCFHVLNFTLVLHYVMCCPFCLWSSLCSPVPTCKIFITFRNIVLISQSCTLRKVC